jgi:GxxExxY protein
LISLIEQIRLRFQITQIKERGEQVKVYSENSYPKKDVTEKIIRAAFAVHNKLGAGFVEKVYENALVKELSATGLKVEQQKQMKVVYGGEPVGEFIVDLLVDDNIIVELKATHALGKSFVDKLLHYLKVSNLPVGLLLNFGGSSVQIKRKVYSTSYTKSELNLSNPSNHI